MISHKVLSRKANTTSNKRYFRHCRQSQYQNRRNKKEPLENRRESGYSNRRRNPKDQSYGIVHKIRSKKLQYHLYQRNDHVFRSGGFFSCSKRPIMAFRGSGGGLLGRNRAKRECRCRSEILLYFRYGNSSFPARAHLQKPVCYDYAKFHARRHSHHRLRQQDH